MMQVKFTTDLGAVVSVDVNTPEQITEAQRYYGRRGWTSGDVPKGGHVFPYDNFEDFDWSLIGARKWTNPEGEVLIIHRGMSYRVRMLDAVKTAKMQLPVAIKISRGARPGDPKEIKEAGDAEIFYVTLAIFRGGKRQDRFAVPRERPASDGPQQRAAS